jgi:hypothetical protein
MKIWNLYEKNLELWPNLGLYTSCTFLWNLEILKCGVCSALISFFTFLQLKHTGMICNYVNQAFKWKNLMYLKRNYNFDWNWNFSQDLLMALGNTKMLCLLSFTPFVHFSSLETRIYDMKWC